MKTIKNRRLHLFVKSLGYNDEDYFNDFKEPKVHFNVKYMKFTSDMEQKYLQEKNIPRIFDYKDFDKYCIDCLEKLESKDEK